MGCVDFEVVKDLVPHLCPTPPSERALGQRGQRAGCWVLPCARQKNPPCSFQGQS